MSTNFTLSPLKITKRSFAESPESHIFSPTSTLNSLSSPAIPGQHSTATIESNLITYQKVFMSSQYIPKKGTKIDATDDPAYQELASRMAHYHNCSRDEISFGYYPRDQKSHSYYSSLDYFGFKIKGRCSGYGCLFYSDTQKIYFVGTFQDGRINSHDAKLFFRDGQVYYKGTLANGLRQGYGRLYSNLGQLLYDGIWEKDREEGKNIIIRNFEGLVSFEGSIVNGLKEGWCKEFNGLGEKWQEGLWKTGKKNGQFLLYNVEDNQLMCQQA
jgi:antitoxin component YwqK of YwqJK toxin-antitoxin module